MKVTLITHTPEPEKVVAAAAKLCYSNKVDIATLMNSLDDPEEVRKFIETLMEMHHHSPLEHVSFTFGIEGVSRSFLAQITRHRIAAFSVRSQRYCAEDLSAPVVPPSIANDEARAEEFRIAMELAWSTYRQFLEMGVPKEDARAVLPNACATRMIVTMNARELLHFFSQRCCTSAPLEIRQVACKMLEECKKVAPMIFKPLW